jgi:hypothetical protein
MMWTSLGSISLAGRAELDKNERQHGVRPDAGTPEALARHSR